ncbi:MAG: glycosyltransferase [Planctomycetes bacterium]|nr:glycosyltransferase [Planctomycetota bacterium]
MPEPLLSVVIPSLNRVRYIDAAIDSVLQQEAPVECIVMDGGSSDETIEILRGYGERITWISAPDRGQGDAINQGWRLCKGEILTWLNADDVWAPGAAGKVLAYFQSHPEIEVFYGDCGKIDLNGKEIGMSYRHDWDLNYALEYCDHCIPQPASFIRRRALEEIGWLDASFTLIDCELWLRLSSRKKISYQPGILAYARNLSGYDLRHFAQDRVRLIKKFFSQEELPREFRRIKRRAVSNACLRAIEDLRCLERKPRGLIASYLLQAILADPGNFRRVWQSASGLFKRLFVQLGFN